jgi:hypothetical protein
MTDEGKRYVELADALKALGACDPRYSEVVWWRLSEPEREEIERLLIAIDEVVKTEREP